MLGGANSLGAQILRAVTDNAAAERAVGLSRAHAVRAPPAPLPRRRWATGPRCTAKSEGLGRPILPRPLEPFSFADCARARADHGSAKPRA